MFSAYKVGGISDFLSDKKKKKSKKGNEEELCNLFNKQNKNDSTAEGENQGGVNAKKVDYPRPSKKIDPIPPRKTQQASLNESEVGESDKGIIGGKRKRTEDDETTELDRKQQRENRKKQKVKSDNEEKEDPERLSRTIFVGNIPVTTTRKELKSFFIGYGEIETVRLRSVPVAKPKYSRKLAIVKKEFHSERNSMNAYVVFKNKSDTDKALKAKGLLFKDMHLRVDTAVKKEVDNKLSVFVGNLPFNIQEEELREHFSQCGDVDDVRIIRDKETGVGKGFGYISFEKRESVGFAIKLQNSELKGRKLRVFRSVDKTEAKRSFNKKRDRQFRMKDVKSKNKNMTKRQNNKFSTDKKHLGNPRHAQTKGGKSFKKGGKKFAPKKGKGRMAKKR